MHDMLAKCVAEILNQILHIFLGRLREILLNIKLADGLAEIAFRNSKKDVSNGDAAASRRSSPC